MLVAIRRKDALETRLRGPSGHWSAARRLAIADHRVDAIRAAIAPDGAAWLLWSSTSDGVRTVSTAVRRPGTTRFGSVRILERSTWTGDLADSTERWRLRIAAPERGTGATAAWTGWDGEHLRVMAAPARGDAPLGAPTPVTAAGTDHVLGDLALGAGRRAIAVVARPDEESARALVAVARGTGAFGAPELVRETAGSISGEALALDPATRRPTLVWTEVRVAVSTPLTTAFASTRR